MGVCEGGGSLQGSCLSNDPGTDSAGTRLRGFLPFRGSIGNICLGQLSPRTELGSWLPLCENFDHTRSKTAICTSCWPWQSSSDRPSYPLPCLGAFERTKRSIVAMWIGREFRLNYDKLAIHALVQCTHFPFILFCPDFFHRSTPRSPSAAQRQDGN